jgi:ABC-2 type transport system ATP-binding protein
VERPHLVAPDPRLTKPSIQTRGLTKDYGEGRGLFDLDLEVEQGEVFGFLGPNGAGKSTTMRLLLDLIAPTSGSARVLDLDTHAECVEIRRRVVLAAAAAILTSAAAVGFSRRDLRG